MISNYLKIAWRNLIKNKAHSIINILGLSAGMAVAILIGLWIYSELTFNRDYPNHDRLGIVMQNQTFNGETNSQTAVPYVMGDQLRKEYSGDFKHVAMATWLINHVLAFGENKINQKGNFIEPEITDMLSLRMLKGTRKALYDKQSIILSASTAKALFGDADQ
ncbi:ABC transporter permease [Mucilaginibacter sp. KACC 22063]|uniref:ABC transporter permease n=1 Tax=Mucilaginibacter sp. KACC 22063 TaxID=3025666 RepID=UPI002365E5CA|nr:ABC transporter permease [Mucilaginibacter sp. KACC 22063]WDF56753.1 ABC transporter permease [Mucilaginibacter sp. KACC 22063]